MRLIISLSILTLVLTLPVAGAAQSLPGQTTVTVDGQVVTSTSQVQSCGKTTVNLGGDSVDVVGGTSGGSTKTGLAKGNSYRIDTEVVLDNAEFYLDFSDTQNLTFYVFESSVEFGTYFEVHRNIRTVTGNGSGWYSSGSIAVQLFAGRYYIIAVSWDGSLGYYYNTGDTEATSFGAHVHGYASGTDPLPGAISSTNNDQAIYHQRLTTNEGWNPRLAVSPDPLVAGAAGTFFAINCNPIRDTFLAYSLTGTGSTYIPSLNITLDLAKPKQAGSGMTSDHLGRATWNLPIPSNAAGLNVWFQAVQYSKKTDVVATSIN